MLRLTASAPLALVFLAACGSDLKAPAPVPPPAANFAPSDGIVPLPSDLLYSGSIDGTISIPGVDDGTNPDASPPQVALSAMDGWSTSAPFTIAFNTPLDATTVIAGTTVRIFEVTLTGTGGAVTGVVGELAINTDFTVGMAPEVDTNDSSIRVYLERPLNANTSYMWVLTNGIQNIDGTPTEKFGEYLLASSLDPFDVMAPIAALQVLVGAQLSAAVGQGMVRDDIILTNVFTTQGTDEVLSTFVAITAGQEAAVIAALCAGLPSGCAGEDTNVDPNNASSLVVNTPSTITTADRVPGSPGIADLYTGELTVPYYLTGAANPSDTAGVVNTDPLTQRIQARFNFLPGGLDDHHVTKLNVLPATTGQEVLPVLISVPNNQAKPGGGWPVVVFQHGITGDRTNMLGIADAFAAAGIMVVAIDLPLHGFTTDADPVIFAGYDAAQAGARERIFGLDLLTQVLGEPTVAGPDGTVDSSGSHFINLANLLVTRDNLRQASSDLLHLTSQLATLDYDGGGSDVNAARFHFVGHSLGGIVGIPFLRLANANFQSATLAMPGGGIAKLLNGSDRFGPVIQAGLAGAGVLAGTVDFEGFLWAAQTTIDSVDPINHAATLAASGLPIHFIEVVGGGAGGGLPDAVIPNTVALAPLSGSGPTVTALGLADIIVDTVDAGGIQGVVHFIEGDHSSILDPTANAAAFSEMQAQTVEFADTSGTSLTLVDETVVDITP